MRSLIRILSLTALVAVLLSSGPARAAPPPFQVTVVVTGDNAEGQKVSFVPPPGGTPFTITIGADNRGTGLATVAGPHDFVGGNGLVPQQGALRIDADTTLDLVFDDPFGGGGGVQPIPRDQLKAAIREFVNARKSQEAKLKAAFRQALAQFCKDLDLIQRDVLGGGMTPREGLDAAVARIGAFNGAINLEAETATTNLTGIGGAILANLGTPSLKGLLIGDCGALDGFRARLAREYAKLFVKMKKKVKRYIKKVGRANRGFIQGMLFAQPRMPPPPMPNPAPLPPPKPKGPTIDATGGASNEAATGDGILCVSGTADPATGSPVTITIIGPGGTKRVQKDIKVDVDDCSFFFCFTDLPEGNYEVQVEDNGNRLSPPSGAGVP